MARALRIQYPGAYYHVTCRGNERKPIFADGQDEEVFFEKLSLSSAIYNVSILSYVCMTNHDHFVRLMGQPRQHICQRGKRTKERTILMELLYRFCRIPQPEIGRLVGGIDYSGVSQARKRLHIKLEKEPKLKKEFDGLTDQLIKLSRLKI